MININIDVEMKDIILEILLWLVMASAIFTHSTDIIIAEGFTLLWITARHLQLESKDNK